MASPQFSPTTNALSRAGIIIIAPTVMLLGHGYHPWIGTPDDPDFFQKLGAAVSADPTRWWIAHLGIALGSGLLILAFLAIRAHLRAAGEERWSVLGLPFIVMGSVLYTMLPAIEFAPLGASRTGADPGSVQAALVPWFSSILLTSAAIFALGILGYVVGIARSGVLNRGLSWVVLAALIILAATRFFPVGAAQLYVGPAATVVALWPLAYVVWKQESARG